MIISAKRMFYFFLQQQKKSNEIKGFPQIQEFACQKLQDVKANSLLFHRNKGLEICFIHKGQYDWRIEGNSYTLHPGYASITCPWQVHGNSQGILQRGVLYWLIVSPKKFPKHGDLELGPWSNLSKSEQIEIGKILIENKNFSIRNGLPIKTVMDKIYLELQDQPTYYQHRVNSLLDELFVYLARELKSASKPRKDLSETDPLFGLQQAICAQLAHSWTLDELSHQLRVSRSTAYHKIKNATGFSPLEYVNYLRIVEAQEQLRQSVLSITDIALACGFSSSQHFAGVFKKFCGKTPLEYKNSENLEQDSDNIPVW